VDCKLNLSVDRVIQDKAYPALAQWAADPYTSGWRQFAHHWPNTVPVELLEHCRTHGVECELSLVEDSVGGYYPVGLGFFNFDVDYFGLMSPLVQGRLRNQTLIALFYYHEGDNPARIKQRLDQLCVCHRLPADCYRFVSGNTAADHIPGFAYFPDHELLFWHRNREVMPAEIHHNPRPFEFTALSRTHKWWRATVMADLERTGLLGHSQWSYGTTDIGDRFEDNPIEIDHEPQLRAAVDRFMSHAPYTCDSMTTEQQNDHHLTEYAHYTQSYCNIVLETHFDADQSGGAFLTEKTFKPIKHGQPFVIVGAPGSLADLRSLGYRTFDHVIDNSYDLEINNTQRWIKIKAAIAKIKSQNMQSWFNSCKDDIEHNQQLFCSSKQDRLNTLLERLNS
jgi:hypothetical protein